MRVALVNTNRYLEPPVIPVGIEYLAHYLEREGHEVKVIDLAFAGEPGEEMARELAAFDPRVVGFSVRNVDTSLYHDNVFLLEDAAQLIAACRRCCDAVVVVGSAVLAGPREVAEYLGCDHAVYGPGERAFPSLISCLEKGVPPPRLVNGWDSSFDREEVPARGRWVDYIPTCGRGGGRLRNPDRLLRGLLLLPGSRPPLEDAQPPRAVAREVAALKDAGCGELHLCDCEFNQELDAAKELLREMGALGLDIPWSLYMKPLPHDEALFRLLAGTGAHAVTLSVDSDSLRRGAYGLDDLRGFIRLAHRHGLRVAVDLLIGFPGEGREELRGLFDALRAAGPDAVGVSAWIRVFKYTHLGRSLREGMPPDGTVEGDDPEYLRPVYYSRLSVDDCRELMGDDPVFRIEGLERRSNYERLA